MHFQILKSTNYKLKIIWAIMYICHGPLMKRFLENTSKNGGHTMCVLITIMEVAEWIPLHLFYQLF